MGGFQNFAISFTIISILAGCLTSYYVAFKSGGPVAITCGWLLVGLMSTIIALAMAEIASAFPTAGGLYYWASKLGSPGWGWATGWFNLIGQIAVTASIGYGLAISRGALRLLVRLREPDERLVRAPTTRRVRALRDLPDRDVAHQHVQRPHHVDAEHDLGLLAHGGVAFIVARLIIVPNHHQSFGFVFSRDGEQLRATGTQRSTSSPVFWFVFGLGLLMSQYTITGFDASAHIAEETHARVPHGGRRDVHVGRRRRSPSAGSSCSRSRSRSRARRARSTTSGTIVAVDLAESMSQNWAEILLLICVVAQFFCLTASVTSASRMMFAFSRDGAVPGHRVWRQVAPQPRPAHTPSSAIGVLSGR